MQHYVYEHRDPNTQEIVYVGHGKGARAWSFWDTVRRDGSPGNRKQEHGTWAKNFLSTGYSPDQLVFIVARGMSKNEACRCERKLLDSYSKRPRFNKIHSLREEKEARWSASSELGSSAQFLRQQGDSYQQIASKLNVSAMTVWRNLKEQTYVN